ALIEGGRIGQVSAHHLSFAGEACVFRIASHRADTAPEAQRLRHDVTAHTSTSTNDQYFHSGVPRTRIESGSRVRQKRIARSRRTLRLSFTEDDRKTRGNRRR